MSGVPLLVSIFRSAFSGDLSRLGGSQMFSKATKFESLLEAVPDALVGMDQSGTIRFVNHQTESLFGYDRDDLVGQKIETLVPDPLWQIYVEHRDSYFADPRSRSMGLDLELSARHKDGWNFPVDLSLTHIDTGDVLLEVTALRDVTKQRQAAKNAQRMTAIVQHSDDAIISTTLGGIITSWNPGAQRMYGYSGSEAVGRPVTMLAPEDRTAESAEILARINAGQSFEHFETTRVRRDGSLVAVSLSVSPIRNDDGEAVAVCSIARDVTERRSAFEAARAMIESSQDSLVSISAEGKITDANQATVTATGVARERLIGTDFAQYFTEPERAREVYQQVFAQRVTGKYSLTIRHQDGTLTDVVYSASVHRDLAGGVRGVFAAARDVTKLTQALESLRAMIESSLDSMVSISPEGMITDVNEATVKVTGVPRDRLMGTAFSDYFTDPDRANEIYQQVFAGGMAVDYPLTMRHRNGALTEVLYNASVYRDQAGKVLGVFAAARDVTAQKRALSELARQRAADLDRMEDLESFQRLTVGRELQMIELKKEIEYLRRFRPTTPGEPDEQV
jgi:PAS domain S-box-containing protein